MPRRDPAPGLSNTFRVARASRVLAASVPSLVAAPDPVATRRPDPPPRDHLAVSAVPDRPGREKSRAVERDDDLTLRDRSVCKERPRDSRGAGGSRAFVPWCRRS